MAYSTNTHKRPSDEDEIDIRLLFIRIVQVFSRNIGLLSIAVILGFTLGLLQYFLSRPVYQSSLIASSRMLTMYRLVGMVDILNKLAVERNDTLLGRLMNVSPSIANKVVQIEARSIKSSVGEMRVDAKTASLDDNVFEVIIQTYDNRSVDELQNGLLYYLQNNDFVEKRIAIEKHNLNTMQSRVREEIKKLDSLRFSVTHLISKGLGGNSTVLMNDPASVNRDIMTLYEKELNIQAELLLIDDIQVIQGFVPFSQSVSPKLSKCISVSVGFAFILAIALIIVLEIRRGLKIPQVNSVNSKIEGELIQ
jgi:hypothetical protein